MPPRKKYRSPDVTPRAKRTVHGISQDMKRKREMYRHHPYDHLHPHPAHHPWEHPNLPPDHDPHTLLHEEELGPHTNQPGPIRFATKITQTGRRDLRSEEHKPVERQ
ncbi:hypothetical protein L1S32_02230 [Methanogenium sp. S4BF]|uniref:hypothetical protein n=1 Tax=Methanogenium sp. S4BF TaxID=1789226 RepID=UPI0024177383|nr:hypothetical protein [Methanogenium sp. S4BF]WFN34959.1 hypothetical protein L1S32_02230 [Methanogenium sp. S4BF]